MCQQNGNNWFGGRGGWISGPRLLIYWGGQRQQQPHIYPHEAPLFSGLPIPKWYKGAIFGSKGASLVSKGLGCKPVVNELRKVKGGAVAKNSMKKVILEKKRGLFPTTFSPYLDCQPQKWTIVGLRRCHIGDQRASYWRSPIRGWHIGDQRVPYRRSEGATLAIRGCHIGEKRVPQ